MDRPLNIVILGGGTAGWMAAVALATLLPRSRFAIRLIESEEIGIVGVGEATLPHMKYFNDLVGIDEAEMMRATKATFKLGIEFVDWGYKGASYIHPFGTFGAARQGLGLHHQWLRAIQNGWQGGIEQFSFAVMAARSNRFEFPQTARPTINSTFAYAYHFDASLYAKFVRGIAEQRGVTRTEGKVQQVRTDPDTGDVSSLELQSGEIIQGDFFIDCSGFRSMILGSTLGVEWEDWKQWLPCDRAIAVPTANTGSLDPFTRSTAHGSGWQWRIPLQHRTGNGHVYSSPYMEADEAERILLDNLEGEPLAEPRHLRFTTGMRKTFWSHNVIAIGLSSGFLEPLESTSIHLIQNGIQRILALFPDREISPVERDEYNRGMRDLYEDVRDFIILHYKATQRDDTAFWRYVRDMDVPDSLARKMELWRLHGRVFREGAELFGVTSWVAVMLGQNVWPRRYDPIVDSLDENRVAAAMAKMRTDFARAAEALPSQEDFLRQAGAWADAAPSAAAGAR